LSKYYLALTQKLMPLRTACAGGHIPLDDSAANEDDDEEEEATPRKRKKKEQKYSEYAYTSKLDKLVSELKHVRDNDPSGKSKPRARPW
jgi:hypothetical protein